MKISRFLLALALPLSLFAAESPVVPDGTEEIDGRFWAFSAAPIRGSLKDAAAGYPLSGVRVRFKHEKGKDAFFHETRTDEAGNFRTVLRFGTYYVDLFLEGYARIEDQEVYTGLAEVSPPLNLPMSRPVGEGQIRIALSWTRQKGGAVKDVDSYLSIPGVRKENALSFHYKGKEYEGTFLDLDDTSWQGPETVTIRKMRPGRYVYYVNNYSVRSDCEALGRSGVRVTVTQGDRTLRTYLIEPNDGRSGNGWTYRLFYIEGGQVHDLDDEGKPFRRYDDSLPVRGSPGTVCQNDPPQIRWDLLEAPAEGGAR